MHVVTRAGSSHARNSSLRPATVFAGVAAVTAACSTGGHVVDDPQPAVAASSPSSSPSSTPTPTPTRHSSTTGPARWGQTYRWDDGLAVTILSATRFRVDANYAAGAGLSSSAAGVKLRVRLHNGTRKAVDPVLLTVGVSAGRDGEQVPEACGADAHWSTPCGFTQQTLAPGGTATATFEYAVPASGLGHVTAVVQLVEYGRQPATFAGPVR